ncbi:hypothetical protein NQ317_015087 [Molorchus minor]|uniref:SET domain-containing protein n=1 Tax=Molorchus minor TaxID=1323400 RepID=A0ABQ9K4R9_9CUCU|nr:hypothetical protein NQ317_015087 [Molorchus minor]
MGMYGRMCVNSFSICNQEFQSIGSGMYLAASIVDHSCKPNAVVTFQGTTLYMRALEEIPALDWTKIFISYIDVMALKEERQKELEKNYYFLCQCPKCLQPEPVIEMTGGVCPNNDCDNCIDMSSTKAGHSCSKCATEITEEFVRQFHEIMDMTSMHLDAMRETPSVLDVCEVCLRKHEGVLYKYNIKHIKILDLTFDSCIDFGKFENATKYGLELIKSYREFYGKTHPMTGLLHLKLGKLLIYEGKVKDALEHLMQAKQILKITHGVTSPLYEEHLLPLYRQAIAECGG